MAVARQFTPDAVWALDLVAGFEDRLYSFGRWKICLGVETIHFPRFPLRIGLALGGKDYQELCFGAGLNAGFLHIDWGLGLNHGLWFSSAKGINLAVMVYTTGKFREARKSSRRKSTP